jgi:stage II sporulation protein AA (anti-sigma F factor antagonist)
MKENSLRFSTEGVSLIVRISGDIDHHSAKEIRERVDKEIFLVKPHILLLDFSDVGFMDSSGIALIIGRAGSVGAVGGSLKIVGMSESMRKLLRLSGIEKIKNILVALEEV